MPHGEGHRLRSELDAPTPNIFELEREQLGERYEILRHGGGGARIDMVCGAVRFDHPAARKLLAVLPRILTPTRTLARRSSSGCAPPCD